MNINPILLGDSYKYGMFLMYPEGTKYVSSYFESRGGEYDEVLFLWSSDAAQGQLP